ncbi:2-iminoacetate synthase ThiH [Campylobacter hepaticus]|uniref:2-iminoacetate synthase ThiH n=1 Tax=Campylobacter hepaticus TaxID=1813019 RepID=A0A6A7JRL9_9BACT|nr:2-iminoacetate synthase ThiH [Campylobacter hepaticus]AXP08461.1 2-iminoacetate synthase ThiH [Campylobacter hepaticus]MDX2322883.1 2-iminoacetate synthase ThiH [Campylobacter hepaticus]MDX2330568.1 2-iminoacetate synthase ThiH [Campylobacter hepaticus]MDX2331983.1 2-iminoacetate synthase ThiH [Campylobacter hepaticus]MDX2371185.1 2-iminoacetate synthase ThiH [Campylobacter hepaticus]
MQDYMQHLPHMQEIKSEVLSKVLNQIQDYDETKYTYKEVKEALNATYLSIENLKALLSSAAEKFIEELAFKSAKTKEKYFGNSISLFTPLYLSNYCNSKCVYCGFQKGNKIARAKLDELEIHEEMEVIAKSGLEEILMLTGEGREFASVEYIAHACKIAREYFKVVGVEIYPMNEDEYKILHENGCDYVTIFQETYNAIKYSKIHLDGEKRVFPYRFNAQERALRSGMRGVAFGALLGIDDFRKDALATALHAYFLQQLYPHAEISISVPRLRPIINNAKIHPKDVSETRLLQVLCAYRLFLPYAGITISSRERKGFRDEVIKLGASKMSAGVSVGIGEHKGDKKGDEQFEISDNRSVSEILSMLKNSNLQAIMSDSIYVG